MLWLCSCLWEHYERGINKQLFGNGKNLHIKSFTLLELCLTSEECPFGMMQALEEVLETFFGMALTLMEI